MKTTLTDFALILLLAACSHPAKQPSDAALRNNLIGAWSVTVIDPDGSSDTRGTFIVAADNSYRSELITTVSNEMRPVTMEGFVRIQDGFLIETTTNALPHWLPEGMRGTLPAGGTTFRTRIVRLDDQQLVVETNQLGGVLYTRVRQ